MTKADVASRYKIGLPEEIYNKAIKQKQAVSSTAQKQAGQPEQPTQQEAQAYWENEFAKRIASGAPLSLSSAPHSSKTTEKRLGDSYTEAKNSNLGEVFFVDTVQDKLQQQVREQRWQSPEGQELLGKIDAQLQIPGRNKGFTLEELLPEGERSFVGSNILAGVLGTARGYLSTMDMLLPESVKTSSWRNMMNFYRGLDDRSAALTAESNAQKGWLGETGGMLIQGATRMVPDVLLAAATGGGSVALNAGKGVMGIVGSTLKGFAKNPSFWNSIAGTLGITYEEAKAEGATETEAMATAVISSLINAGIESGTGIEGIGKGKKGVLGWVRSALEEGGEEVVQGIVENMIAKTIYDKDAPFLSMTDGNAVINPVRMAGEFGMGAALGGIMGAPYAAAETIGARNLAKKQITLEDIARYKPAEVVKQEYAAAVDKDLVQFAEYSVNNPQDNKSAYQLKDVSPRQASDIKKLTGIEVKGFGTEAKSNAFRHIEHDHGVNGATDQSMADVNDVARMQYVIDNYDSMELLPTKSKEFRDKNQEPAPMVKLSKRVNGNYYVVEAVPDSGKRKLEIVTAYKEEAVSQTRDAISPYSDVQNASGNTASNAIIPQSAENSNNNFGGVVALNAEAPDIFANENEGIPRSPMATAPFRQGGLGGTQDSYGARGISGEKAQATQQVMDVLSNVFGVRFSWYDGPEDIGGYYDPNTREIYLNRNSDEPILTTISHEFIHDLKVNDPEGYAILRQIVEKDMNIAAFNEYRASLLEAYDENGIDYKNMSETELYEHVLEEACCDLFAEVMRDPATIRKIAQQDLTLAQKIVEGLQRFIDNITRAFSEWFVGENAEIRGLVHDFEEVKRVYQAVLENSAKKGSQSEGVSGELKLSANKKSVDENEALQYNENIQKNKVLEQSKDGAIYGSADAKALGEGRKGRSYDSIWKQSDDSEETYERLGGAGKNPSTILEARRGYIPWSGRLQSDGLSAPRTKKRALSVLREISARRISDVDADGRSVSNEIKEYFKNTVVKNEKGELIPLFHGTDAEFNVFKYGDFGFHLGTAEQAMERGNFIKEVYVNIKNPLFISEDHGIWPSLVIANEALSQGIIFKTEYDTISKMEGFSEKRYDAPANKSLRNLLKARGYDGIVYNNEYEGEGLSFIAFDPEQIKYVSNQQPTSNPDLRYSVSRKSKAEGAMAKYDESGDARDLPDRAWTRAFARDTKNRTAYLENQRMTLDYQLKYADKDSRAAIEESMAALDKKIAEAKRNELVAKDLQDTLDNAALNRNIELAPVIHELADVDKGLKFKNGNYRFNDFYRNMERFFGAHFDLVRPLLDAFDGAKGNFARLQVRLKSELHGHIVKELGIKKGSDESKAVQWIAEGERNPRTAEEKAERDRVIRLKLENGEITQAQVASERANYRSPYTEEMLYKEFGSDAAERIIRAENWFREQYDMLINEINKTQRMLYPNRPDKLIPKRPDYMRHFREMETGFRGLYNIATGEQNIAPELVMVSDHTKPKEKWASIKQAREGKATDEGAIEGFLDYLPQAAYAIYINPYIDKFRGLARDIAELKSATGETDANAFVKYLSDFASHLAGKSSGVDRALIDSLGSSGRKLVKTLNWFNNRAKGNAVLANLGSTAKQVMNLPNGVKLLENPAGILKGVIDMVAAAGRDSEVRKNWAKSDFLTERFLDKGDAKFEKNGIRKGATWLLGAADEFGTRAIWNAAYSEGVQLSRDGEIDMAPERYADVLTRRAVAGRGVGEVPLAYASQAGKLVLPFQIEVSNSWNVDRDVLQGKAGTGQNGKALSKAGRMILGYLVTWGLGAALTALLGDDGAFNPIDDILDGIMQGWEEEKEGDLFDKIVKMGQRSVQNLAGDFIGSRAFGWLTGELLSSIDEDWAENMFNGSVMSQGVNVPAVQSLVKAGKDAFAGDLMGMGAEAVTSFVMPLAGKQIDKSVRGIADFVHGGKYKNDIYKELSTGERGEMRYNIEKNVPNFLKSALFGPSSLKAGSEYWEGKDAESRLSSAERKRQQKEREAFFDAYKKEHADSEAMRLYREVERKEVLPFEPVSKEQDFTDNGKEYILQLTDAQIKRYQAEQNKLMEQLYSGVTSGDAYRSADAETKMQLLEGARKEAESYIKTLIKNDKLYSAPVSKLLTEGDWQAKKCEEANEAAPSAESKLFADRAGEVMSFANSLKNSGRLRDADAEKLYTYLKTEPKVDFVDEEIYRIDKLLGDADAGGLDVSGSYIDLLKFTEDKKEYRIPVSAGHMLEVVEQTDTATRKALSSLFRTASYQNAIAQEKADMIRKKKKAVRKEVEEGLKKRFPPVRVDMLDKIARMK